LGRVIREISGEEYVNYEYDVQSNRTRIHSSLGANIENEFNELSTKSNTYWQTGSYS